MSKSWRLTVEAVGGGEAEYYFIEEPSLVPLTGPGDPSIISYVGKSAGSEKEWEVYIVMRNVVAWYVQEVEEE